MHKKYIPKKTHAVKHHDLFCSLIPELMHFSPNTAGEIINVLKSDSHF